MSVLYGLILIDVALWIAVGLLDIDSSEVSSRNSFYIIVAAVIGAGILFIFRAIWFIKRIKDSLIRSQKQGTDQNALAPMTIVRMGSETS
jgi:hypothetical protein